MERFHYTIKQKLQVFDLVRSGQSYKAAEQFPHVTQKQIEEWKNKEEEMKDLPLDVQNTKYTLHKGPRRKYEELYTYLYQQVKEMRSNKEPVTVYQLIHLAEVESTEIGSLTNKGKMSLIWRFMEQFNLSIRETTGSVGFREEQANEDQNEARNSFLRVFKTTIIEKLIPPQNIFNMDQTGIF